jgi:hypothetical protein
MRDPFPKSYSYAAARPIELLDRPLLLVKGCTGSAIWCMEGLRKPIPRASLRAFGVFVARVFCKLGTVDRYITYNHPVTSAIDVMAQDYTLYGRRDSETIFWKQITEPFSADTVAYVRIERPDLRNETTRSTVVSPVRISRPSKTTAGSRGQ